MFSWQKHFSEVKTLGGRYGRVFKDQNCVVQAVKPASILHFIGTMNMDERISQNMFSCLGLEVSTPWTPGTQRWQNLWHHRDSCFTQRHLYGSNLQFDSEKFPIFNWAMGHIISLYRGPIPGCVGLNIVRNTMRYIAIYPSTQGSPLYV